MAGTSRFHDKLHRANHHSVVTPGLPDSAYDPIASQEYPFRGDFVLSGALSAANDVTLGGSLSARGNGTVSSLAVQNDLVVGASTTFGGSIFTNNTGSVVTTNSYSVTANNGPGTLTFNYNKGVYINGTYGTIPTLTVGYPGYDAGVINVSNVNAVSAHITTLDAGLVHATNVDASSARLTTLTVTSAVGIGTDNPQHSLHVVGDVIIYGTLTANGNSFFQNTIFTTTSSLSIVNTGTGAGLTVSQEGNQPIAAFYDHESSISLWADGSESRPGWVGVKTHTPNVEFTVQGDISSSGVIYSNTSNSNRWTTTHTTVTSHSASWGIGYSTVVANSATWSAGGTGYAAVVANSAAWNAGGENGLAVYNTVNELSTNWDSSYVTVLANSGIWDAAAGSLGDIDLDYLADVTVTSGTLADGQVLTYDVSAGQWKNSSLVSGIIQGSSLWDSTYTTVTANSSTWSSAYTLIINNSATWNTNSLSGSTDVVITSPANNALLQYSTSQGKWVNANTLTTSGTLTAGSIDLTTAAVSTYATTLTASEEFLLIRINGTVRKLRLWD